MLQILALVGALVAADPPAVKLSASPEKPAKCRLVKVTADTDAKAPLWRVDGPAVDVESDGKVLRFVAGGSGTVTVRCYTVAGDTVAEGVLAVVIDAPPEPIPPPRPDDPFVRELQAAYDADPTATKAVDVKQMAALYREAVNFAGSDDVSTVGILAARVKEARDKLIPTASLLGVRKRIAEELSKSFPSDGPLTAEKREQAKAVFARIATALDAVK